MLPSARSASWWRQCRDTAKYSSPVLPTAHPPTRRTAPGGRSAAGIRSGSLIVPPLLGDVGEPPTQAGNLARRSRVRRVRDVPRGRPSPLEVVRTVRRLTIVLGLLPPALFAGAAPALAVAPFALSEQITDQVDALGSSTSDVQDALDQLRQDKGIELFVVYVDSFDGASGQAWATQTLHASGLSGNQAVFAVATGDRKYGFDAGTAEAQAALNAGSGDIENELGNGNWAGAAIAAADALAGGSSSSSSSDSGGGSSSGFVTLGVVLALVWVAGGVYLFSRARRKRRRELEATQHQAQLAPPDPHAGTPTEVLNGRASEALLDLDERVRTAQVNVDFARTHFGTDAVPDADDALGQTQSELARAFTTRQELDDEIPEDEPTRRRMLTELLSLTDSAAARLKAQSDALDALRAQEANAPQAIEALGGRIQELQARLPEQERRLA